MRQGMTIQRQPYIVKLPEIPPLSYHFFPSSASPHPLQQLHTSHTNPLTSPFHQNSHYSSSRNESKIQAKSPYILPKFHHIFDFRVDCFVKNSLNLRYNAPSPHYAFNTALTFTFPSRFRFAFLSSLKFTNSTSSSIFVTNKQC